MREESLDFPGFHPLSESVFPDEMVGLQLAVGCELAKFSRRDRAVFFTSGGVVPLGCHVRLVGLVVTSYFVTLRLIRLDIPNEVKHFRYSKCQITSKYRTRAARQTQLHQRSESVSLPEV